MTRVTCPTKRARTYDHQGCPRRSRVHIKRCCRSPTPSTRTRPFPRPVPPPAVPQSPPDPSSVSQSSANVLVTSALSGETPAAILFSFVWSTNKASSYSIAAPLNSSLQHLLNAGLGTADAHSPRQGGPNGELSTWRRTCGEQAQPAVFVTNARAELFSIIAGPRAGVYAHALSVASVSPPWLEAASLETGMRIKNNATGPFLGGAMGPDWGCDQPVGAPWSSTIQ